MVFVRQHQLVKSSSAYQSHHSETRFSSLRKCCKTKNIIISHKNTEIFKVFGLLKNVEYPPKNVFFCQILEIFVAVLTKCNWTFFKFLGVNSTSEEKNFISSIHIPKTRTEVETKFVGKKQATFCVDFYQRDICGMTEYSQISVFFTFFR